MSRCSKKVRDWRPYLPDFESIVTVKRHQRSVANALRRLQWPEASSVRTCTQALPCRSGLCPRCARCLRINLLNFLSRKRLHRRQWLFVTVRVEGWTIDPGDTRRFGKLRDHPLIEAFLARVRRLQRSDVLIFGSIETVYRVVGNVPRGKPFHLHLMVSGLAVEELTSLLRVAFPLSRTDVLPLDVQVVDPTEADFIGAASYAMKQPFWKKSSASPDAKGARQWPKAAELRELVSNLGVHAWTGRLILFGLRCDGGRFRFSRKMSATAKNANSTTARKPVRLPRRKPP